jgi:hypothetical protein
MLSQHSFVIKVAGKCDVVMLCSCQQVTFAYLQKGKRYLHDEKNSRRFYIPRFAITRVGSM